MTGYVLGIDGGGSHTRALIMEETGKVCGAAECGPSNYDDIGIETAAANIREAVDLARLQAGLSQAPFDAAFLGLGGVASAADREILKKIAVDLHLAPEPKIGVDHDLRIALAGGLSGQPGIVQIAGTGSACYGRNAAGNSWRSGGWGPLIADEGSGYWLGIQAMKAATRSFDGRMPPTPLVAAVLSRLQLSHMDEIMYRLYAQEMTRAEIAALAPLVIESARTGDETSLVIIEEGAQAMADCVLAVANRLGFMNGCELALTGGIFQAGPLVVVPLRIAVNQRLPDCKVIMAQLPPVVGACLLALELLDIKLKPKAISELKQTTL